MSSATIIWGCLSDHAAQYLAERLTKEKRGEPPLVALIITYLIFRNL
jgi:hypothetical protein